MAEESILRALLCDHEEDAKELNRTRSLEQIAMQERKNAESQEQDATNDRKAAENTYLDTIKLFQETLLGEFEELQEIISGGIAGFSEEQTILEETVKGNAKRMKISVKEIKTSTATKLQQLEAMFRENAKENREAQGILMDKIVSLEKKVEELTNVSGPSTNKPKKPVDNGVLQNIRSPSRDTTTIPRKFSRELIGLQDTKEFAPDYTNSPYQEWNKGKLINTVHNPTPSTQLNSARDERKNKREQGREGFSQGSGSGKDLKRQAEVPTNSDNHEDQQPAMKKRKLSSAQKADGFNSSLPPLVSYKAQINSGKNEEENEEEIETEGEGKF